MPSIGEIPRAKVRALCETTERLLKPPVLTDSERAALHASDVPAEDRSKDDWWKRLSEVQSYARRKERWTPIFDQAEIDEAPLMDTLADQPVEVTLSNGRVVLVRPASWDRLMVVEDLWYWLGELETIRTVLRKDPENFERADDLMKRVRDEIGWVRAWAYAQVCAPGTAPLDMPDGEEAPRWARELTMVDHSRLVAAWLEVHVRRPKMAESVVRAKYPASTPSTSEKDGPVGSMSGFPFMMASIAYREKKSPAYVKRDRSLSELMTTYMVQGQQQTSQREKSEAKAEAKRRASTGRAQANKKAGRR